MHLNSVFDQFIEDVRTAIVATKLVAPEYVDVQFPRANIPADLTFPTFRWAQVQGVDPQRLAKELAVAIEPPADSLIGAVEAVGPYLNVTLHAERFAQAVLNAVFRENQHYGKGTVGLGRTVVIDYSSPNVAKRMHVGHIRSTIIGQALVNIFRALGYHVIGDNHLGDWGKQFGVMIAAILREGKPQAQGEEALALLEQMYARYHEAMQNDPALDEEARRWSRLLEQGDPQARQLWQWCVEATLQANQRNYQRLGVHFDYVYGESFYEAMLPGIIAQAIEQGIAIREDDGSVVVKDLEPGLPTFLLQRRDGGTLYLTRDIATIAFRMREFSPSIIIYVVGATQELHFRQVFALARAMGLAEGVQLVHVPFGTISDAEGHPLSTRRGNMVYLETLLDEAVRRARVIVEQKNTTLSEEEKHDIAEAVGIGAVIYNDLYQDPRRNITLDWDRMLATEGNSATYLQYTHARCCSIVRKARLATDDEHQAIAEAEIADSSSQEVPDFDVLPPTTAISTYAALLLHPTEQQLLRHLARFPLVVREAAERYAPSVIATWCYTTAREFGVFFEQCPVLRAETAELRQARLLLVRATAIALKNGLHLLGIQAPERM